MKASNILISLVSLMALITVSCKEGGKEPKTDKQKVSYAIGQQIGRGIKMQEIDVDLDMLKQSIREVIDGKEPRMKPEEMQKAMMDMQKQRMESRRKDGEANVKKGKDYLEANKKKAGIKVTESGLQYEVVTAGKGASPKATDVVKVHYKGTLINGEEFDSSYKRKEPAQFPVNGVIKGWTEALQLMKTGGKWKLYIPSDLAYGRAGRPGIPPNSVLVFEVELLEVVKKEAKAKKGK